MSTKSKVLIGLSVVLLLAVGAVVAAVAMPVHAQSGADATPPAKPAFGPGAGQGFGMGAPAGGPGFGMKGEEGAFMRGMGKGRRHHRPRGALGQVTAIQDNAFTMKLRDGKEVTVNVTDQTKFRKAGSGEASFSDLQVGNWVMVAGRHDNGENEARLVVILPDDFDPNAIHHTAGKIESVDADAHTFTITTRQGDELTVQITDQTRFRGISGESDLKPDMMVVVVYRQKGDETPTAMLVAVPTQKGARGAAGEVTAVGDNSITIKPRRGGEITVTLAENACIRSPQGDPLSLSDVHVGDFARMLTNGDPNSPQAWLVIVGNPAHSHSHGHHHSDNEHSH